MIYFGSRQVFCANFALHNKVVFASNQAITALCRASIKELWWGLLSLGATQTAGLKAPGCRASAVDKITNTTVELPAGGALWSENHPAKTTCRAFVFRTDPELNIVHQPSVFFSPEKRRSEWMMLLHLYFFLFLVSPLHHLIPLWRFSPSSSSLTTSSPSPPSSP